jgi:hypothetical protein
MNTKLHPEGMKMGARSGLRMALMGEREYLRAGAA